MSSLQDDIASGAWLKPTDPLRLFLAIVLSGPIVGALFAIVLAFTTMQSLVFQMPHPVNDSEFIQADLLGVIRNVLGLAGIGAIMGGLFGLPATLVVAMPAHAWLVRKTPATIFWYLGLGFVAGAGAGAAYAAGLRAQGADLLILLGYGICVGAVAGCAFWMIRRPDKVAVKLASRPAA